VPRHVIEDGLGRIVTEARYCALPKLVSYDLPRPFLVHVRKYIDYLCEFVPSIDFGQPVCPDLAAARSLIRRKDQRATVMGAARVTQGSVELTRTLCYRDGGGNAD
jgi:hypothetical protein